MILNYLSARSAERDWSPKTWNNTLLAIRGLYKFAIDYFQFVSPNPRHPNPAAAVRMRKIPKSEIVYLGRNEIIELLDALRPHPQARAMVAVLVFAGLRRKELTWLTREDVDRVSGNIRIRSKTVGGESWTAKTNKDRRVPISPDLEYFLSEYEAFVGTGGTGICCAESL